MMKTTTKMDDDEKLEFAYELIGKIEARGDEANYRIVEKALTILEFGGITPRRFIDYLEATGK
jgi:hypothetical protein